jgi:hypothetical protein
MREANPKRRFCATPGLVPVLAVLPPPPVMVDDAVTEPVFLIAG